MHSTITVLTIFPDIFDGFLNSSLIHKAQEKNLLRINLINIRDFASPPHFQVDDTPYGGGAGMVMKPEPLVLATEHAKKEFPTAKVILLTPTGKLFTQEDAQQFSSLDSLILIAGRYEGVDQRVSDLVVDQEISIGDYVLMGGEVPAMVIIETTARLMQDVLGNNESIKQESFSSNSQHQAQLEGPQYTRPVEFRGLKVPDVLLSGNHKNIAAWKMEKSLAKTKLNRPDLIASQK